MHYTTFFWASRQRKKRRKNYTVMAFAGHSSTHVPQSMQVSALTSALSVTVIASTGHAVAHAPHPVHRLLFTTAAIGLLNLRAGENAYPI